MTQRRKLKRRIRERMTRTGESYSSARASFRRRARTAVVGRPTVMIPVAELPRAIAFYRDALGFALRSENPDGSWAAVESGAMRLGLHTGARTSVDTGIGILVHDIDAVRARIVTLGGTIDGDASGVVTARDPDSNIVRIMSRA